MDHAIAIDATALHLDGDVAVIRQHMANIDADVVLLEDRERVAGVRDVGGEAGDARVDGGRVLRGEREQIALNLFGEARERHVAGARIQRHVAADASVDDARAGEVSSRKRDDNRTVRRRYTQPKDREIICVGQREPLTQARNVRRKIGDGRVEHRRILRHEVEIIGRDGAGSGDATGQQLQRDIPSRGDARGIDGKVVSLDHGEVLSETGDQCREGRDVGRDGRRVHNSEAEHVAGDRAGAVEGAVDVHGQVVAVSSGHIALQIEVTGKPSG